VSIQLSIAAMLIIISIIINIAARMLLLQLQVD
jgi:hypothetical protein